MPGAAQTAQDPEIKEYQLVANDAVQGPDFPTGGQVINTKEELREIYRDRPGPDQDPRDTRSLLAAPKRPAASCRSLRFPIGVNKADLVERISRDVYSGKMPLVTEVRDLSTDEIRIDLHLKKDADEEKVLAFLYKNTPLQTNFNVNLTCLVPTENPEVGRPERLGLKEMLWYFLQFRLDVVTRRLENELAALQQTDAHPPWFRDDFRCTG